MKIPYDINSRPVYNTDVGRIAEAAVKTDVIADDNKKIILRRESKKRKGKTVVVIEGCPTSIQIEMLKTLKKHCACGGANKGTNIEIQGDHIEKIKSHFEKLGFVVAQLGG